MKFIRPLFILAILALSSVGSIFAQANGSLAGSVTDANGAIVVGASVSVSNAAGFKKDVVTNAKGEYSVTGLAPGKYTVKVFATKFELYENTEVEIAAGEKNEMMVVLTVGGIVENVDVSNNEQVSTDPANNADATVLKKEDIDALPDDPDEMQAALQALVGAAAGPNGGQIYIDGFTGGQLPSKDQIREIRINSNPFSAEFDRPGQGRIEILTRQGRKGGEARSTATSTMRASIRAIRSRQTAHRHSVADSAATFRDRSSKGSRPSRLTLTTAARITTLSSTPRSWTHRSTSSGSDRMFACLSRISGSHRVSISQ